MPLYDYRCPDCRKKVSIFQTYSEYGDKTPECPECGGRNLQRVLSRIRIARSEESRLDSLADPSAWGGIDENDPKTVAKAMRKMSGEMGEEMGPEFNEAMDRLEAGESPEEIEKSIPSLGGGDSGTAAMSDYMD